MRAIEAVDLAERRRGFVVDLDRARAIECAILGARSGDSILIAGKGHEKYQLVGAEKHEFEDREEAESALSKRRLSRRCRTGPAES
jgi:UDP-N-acetylmuramyl tripeptide synthase